MKFIRIILALIIFLLALTVVTYALSEKWSLDAANDDECEWGSVKNPEKWDTNDYGLCDITTIIQGRQNDETPQRHIKFQGSSLDCVKRYCRSTGIGVVFYE